MLLSTNVFLMNLMTLIGVIVYVLIWICLVYFAKARRKGLNAINKQFLFALLRYWTLSKVLSTCVICLWYDDGVNLSQSIVTSVTTDFVLQLCIKCNVVSTRGKFVLFLTFRTAACCISTQSFFALKVGIYLLLCLPHGKKVVLIPYFAKQLTVIHIITMTLNKDRGSILERSTPPRLCIITSTHLWPVFLPLVRSYLDMAHRE